MTKSENKIMRTYYGANYEINSYTERFNDRFWWTDESQEAVQEVIDILFDYYWYKRDFKNNWWKFTEYKISNKDKYVSDEDAKQITALIWTQNVLKYDPDLTNASPWLWALKVMDQHFVEKLIKFSQSITTPTHTTEKRKKQMKKYDFLDYSTVDAITLGFENAVEDKLLVEHVINYLDSIPNGNIILLRYGVDRGYGRTVDELSDELNMTHKKINYWLKKNETKCRQHFLGYVA